MSGVPNSITQAGTYSSGMPVMENPTWRRNMVRLKHLDELARQVRRLEQTLAQVQTRLEAGE
ncbi:UDP-3-O-acylglucosamine N-acyltransferase [compost metagenome]